MIQNYHAWLNIFLSVDYDGDNAAKSFSQGNTINNKISQHWSHHLLTSVSTEVSIFRSRFWHSVQHQVIAPGSILQVINFTFQSLSSIFFQLIMLSQADFMTNWTLSICLSCSLSCLYQLLCIRSKFFHVCLHNHSGCHFHCPSNDLRAPVCNSNHSRWYLQCHDFVWSFHFFIAGDAPFTDLQMAIRCKI